MKCKSSDFFLFITYICRMEKKDLTQLIKQEALRLGFDDCGIAKAGRLEQEEHWFFDWLDNEFYAGMDYLSRNRDKRIDPNTLMEDAKSVICLLSNYKPAQWQKPELPQIAAFAYGSDYHIVLKERLYLLKNSIQTQTKATMRLFTDTAPILERAWALRAGLGWIGKSALLVSPRFGPFTFISIILIDIELEYDAPINPQCGDCQNCIESCPSRALCAPYTLDARRCISYHTIENKTSCTIDSYPYIFGCDICIRVCPWGTCTPHTTFFSPLPNILNITEKEWMEITPDTFKQLFSGSALTRAGLAKLQNTLTLWNGKPK